MQIGVSSFSAAVQSQSSDSSEFLRAGVRSDLGSWHAAFGEGANAHAFPLPHSHEHPRIPEVPAGSFHPLLISQTPGCGMDPEVCGHRAQGMSRGNSFLSHNDRVIFTASQMPVSPGEKLKSNQNKADRALNQAMRLPLHRRHSGWWKVSGIGCRL